MDLFSGSFSIKAVAAITMFTPVAWPFSSGATLLAPLSLLTPAIMASGFRSLFTTSSLHQRIAATTSRKSKRILGICASQIILLLCRHAPGSWAETSITCLKKTCFGLTALYTLRSGDLSGPIWPLLLRMFLSQVSTRWASGRCVDWSLQRDLHVPPFHRQEKFSDGKILQDLDLPSQRPAAPLCQDQTTLAQA